MTTIAEALDGFLAEQQARLSERTYRNYRSVIGLFADCMNNYGHSTLDDLERCRYEQAYNADDPQAFVELFGPDKIPGQLGEFLGYYMVRKVMAGQELLTAAGTVTKKLAKWLEANNYTGAGETAIMTDRASDAGTDLAAAAKLGELLYAETRRLPRFDPDDIADEHWIEDMLYIKRVESGVLWFDGHPDPVKVPTAASKTARPGWAITLTLAKLGDRWRFIEVGNVYP